MSTELDRVLDALRTRADAAVLPPAVELRVRADHRRRTAVTATVVAVVVVVVGTAAGASVLRPRASAPAGNGLTTASPTPTPIASLPPTAEPDPTADPPACGDDPFPADGGPMAGVSPPVAVMLTGADWGPCYVITTSTGGHPGVEPDHAVEPQPRLCPQAPTYATYDQFSARVRTYMAGPEVGAYEAVMHYRPSQAKVFMEEVRRAADACATFLVDGDNRTEYARIVESGFAGDESLMIYLGADSVPTKDTYPASYIAVVRVGDLVAVLSPRFDLGSDRDFARQVARRAAAKL